MRRLAAPALLLALALPWPAAALPSAESVLGEVGFSAGEIQKVLGGELVTITLKSSSDRELAVAMAFLVTVPPSELMKDARHGLLSQTDPNTLSWGALEGKGSLAQLAKLTLEPDKKRAKLYLGAKPGEDLNLSEAEIKGFKALKGESAVLDQVRKTLLSRYQAYVAKGLDGIADYARGGGKTTPVAGDLRRASEAATGLKKHVPGFYKVLLGYPKEKGKGLEERFDWSNYEAHGTPTYVLTHRMSMQDGDGFVVAQRQFYVSRGYNTEQALAGFFPVKQGTVVLYTNRTSTDQVTGFGGGTKRSIGSRVMASQLTDLFEKVRKKAEQ
jgi:hypothetical protein